MAKGFATDIEAQVQSARARMSFGFVDGVSLFETNSRLFQLTQSLGAIGPAGDSELYRHFPVAAIAALESHFKMIVATIINEGSPYLERGLALARDRLKSASDVVPLLHRKSVSIGDVVAHVIPFNSIASLEATFGALFDADFKAMVGAVRSPHDTRNERDGSSPVVPSVDALWRGLALAFERRHILAHEAATKFKLTFDEAKAAIEACAGFIEALEAILWATVWKDQPLTQYEMNVAAWASCRAVRSALAEDLRQALEIAAVRGERVRFRRLHLEWKAYTARWLAWEGEPSAMGSIRPMLAATSQQKALEARRQAIAGWRHLMLPEGDNG